MKVTRVVTRSREWFESYPLANAAERARLILGIDVGIRNVGVALLHQDTTTRRVSVMSLLHADLGRFTSADECLRCIRIDELLEEIFSYTVGFYSLRIDLAIETQELQRGDAQMSQVAGMMKQAFAVSFKEDRGSIYSQSPSVVTSIAMQRSIDLPPAQCRTVQKREEKKAQVVVMMEWYLEQNVDVYDTTQLQVFNAKGMSLKAEDRRDHVGDALFHALYRAQQEIRA